MGVIGGPGIITSNLDFVLDLSNRRNYFQDDLFIEYLIAGGGGGGSGWGDGVGGGAGGVLVGSTTLSRGSHTIVVGAGGARGTTSSSSRGTTGSNSSIGNMTAFGGGGGGSKVNNDGLNGGCGGGGYGDNTSPHGTGGTGITGQGYKGGDGTAFYRGGSGGGAGSPGIDGITSDSAGLSRADGGIGKASIITGTEIYYGGGGGAGGCCDRGTGYGGLGGGGNAGNQNIDGSDGAVNTGGGGGGGGSYFNRATFGGNGGSGVVIIRYAGSQKATGGNNIYTQDGYTVHIFNSSGTFTVNNLSTGSLSVSIFDLVNISANASAPSYNSSLLDFDGIDDYMLLNHNLDFSNSVTVDVAFKFHSFSASNPRIFEIKDSTNSLQLLRDGSTNKISTYNSISSESLTWFEPIINTYYFATVVFTSSSTVFYLNGFAQSSSGTTSISDGNLNNKVILGVRGDLNPTTFLDGEIGYFRTYNTVLSSAQVRRNYNALKSRYS